MYLAEYRRADAAAYAHRWAMGRNPAYYDYERLGGDCTNFASQCLYAGGAVMNYTPTFGWYYINGNRKAPAWTGAEYLYNFLTRTERSVGPAGELCGLEDLHLGDLISLNGSSLRHSLIVVSAGHQPSSTLVAAHSYDADYRPLSSYDYQGMRCVHITGVWKA